MDTFDKVLSEISRLAKESEERADKILKLANDLAEKVEEHNKLIDSPEIQKIADNWFKNPPQSTGEGGKQYGDNFRNSDEVM